LPLRGQIESFARGKFDSSGDETDSSVISAQADFCIGIASHFPLKRIGNDFGGLLPNNWPDSTE
jgi:hypothetical protein